MYGDTFTEGTEEEFRLNSSEEGQPTCKKYAVAIKKERKIDRGVLGWGGTREGTEVQAATIIY